MDTQSTVSATSELATYRRLIQAGMFSAEAQNSLIGRATMGAIRNAVRKLRDLTGQLTEHLASVATSASIESISGAAGQVIADVGGGTFIVGVGSGQGIKVGDRLTVLAEQVTRNKQGQVVYRQEQPIATLQVVDVSMANRARAKLVSDSAVQPKEGDKIRVDVARASELRGGPASTGAVDSSAEMQRLVKQGDRYVEDKYFPQAIDAYQKALSVQRDSAVLLGKLASALISNRQVTDAEELADRLFAVGGDLSIEAMHQHGFSSPCFGTLTISTAGVSYQPSKGGDAFSAKPQDIVSLEEGGIAVSGGQLGRTVKFFRVRFKDQNGKQRDFDFLARTYDNGKSASWDDALLTDTQTLHRMLIRVVQEQVLRR